MNEDIDTLDIAERTASLISGILAAITGYRDGRRFRFWSGIFIAAMAALALILARWPLARQVRGDEVRYSLGIGGEDE